MQPSLKPCEHVRKESSLLFSKNRFCGLENSKPSIGIFQTLSGKVPFFHPGFCSTPTPKPTPDSHPAPNPIPPTPPSPPTPPVHPLPCPRPPPPNRPGLVSRRKALARLLEGPLAGDEHEAAGAALGAAGGAGAQGDGGQRRIDDPFGGRRGEGSAGFHFLTTRWA